MQHDSATLGSTGLGMKWAVSTAATLPLFSIETLAFVVKIAVAAFVAGLVNIALETARTAWRRRVARGAPRPAPVATTPPAPLLTDIPGEIPGAPSALDDDSSP